MIEKAPNDIAINKIMLVSYRENYPGNVFRSYSGGRGLCGIVVAQKGESVYYFSDGTKKTLRSGQAAVFSDKIAYVIANDGDEVFVHYTINFELASNSKLEHDVLIKPIDFTRIIYKCEKILNFWRSNEITSNLRCISILYDLMADIFECDLYDTIGRKKYISILPAMKYIDNNYMEEITIQLLSDICVMSTTNFRRLFKMVCRISPIKYLLNVRIKNAKELLENSSIPIKEVASKCGFKDAEYFSRFFKNHVGATPSQIRKNKEDCNISLP